MSISIFTHVNLFTTPVKLTRRQRTKEYIRRFQLYHNPPLWSKRWWWLLPGRMISFPVRMSKSLVEIVASVVWRVILSRWFWMKLAKAPEAEVSAMRYLRSHTTIPIPRVWFSFKWNGVDRIIMDRVPGTTLEAVWYDLSLEEKDGFIQQLADVVRQLRYLKSPFGEMICSAAGGAFMDHRIQLFRPVGPFANEEEFNEATLTYVPEPRPSREELCHHIHHPVVFTHNDFAIRNVMVKDGRVTGVIDWEGAGWFPAHWEYVKAHDTNGEGDNVVGAFRPYTALVVPPYPLELEADRRWVAPPRVVYRHY